jgi:hypothetical protein
MPVTINPIVAGTGVNSVSYVGTWASKPAADTVPARTKIVITDYGTRGYSEWVSDGTYWYPVNGSVKLYQRTGRISTPLAAITATGGTAQNFTLPETTLIPTGMLAPQTRLRFEYNGGRSSLGAGAVGTAAVVRIGPLNTTTDQDVGTTTVNATAGQVWRIFSEIYCRDYPTTNVLSTYFVTPGGQSGVNGIIDRFTGPNTGVDQFVSFGFSGTAVAGDVWHLYGYSITLEG